MSYSEGSSVPDENEVSELAEETLPCLPNHILSSYIVNEEKLNTDYILKIYQYFNDVNEEICIVINK